MSMQKYLVAMALMVFAVIVVTAVGPDSGTYAANKSHHLIIGYRLPGDRLVLRQNIIKDSSWMKVVVVEKTFNATKYERITLIEALDQKTNGNGAYASLTKGGPGNNNATLRFKSQRGHGINFIVNVYSRP